MTDQQTTHDATPRRVLILGGGFGGVYTALGLEHDLQESDNAEVTLICRDNFFLYTPMLTEIAASAIETTHAINPIRGLFKRTQFVEGEVTRIDTGARTVSARLPDGREDEFSYDHLVLALGSTTAFHGIEGVQEHSFPIKTLGDAIELRNWVIQILETAAVQRDVEARAALLTFVIVGGGFTGVEMTGALTVFVREALQVYPTIDQNEVRVILVEGAQRLLPEFDANLAGFAQKQLEAGGVEVRLGELVSGVTAQEARLKGGGHIPTRTIVWASGVSPIPLIEQSDLPKVGRGWIETHADLSVPGCAGVWAIGDCAQIPNPLHPGKFQPALAQTAMREARQVARNIVAALRGEAPQPFLYRVIGQLAMLGHHDGIGTVGPVSLRGYPAWALWRAYYLWRLPGLSKKVSVAIDWVFEDLFGRDISQIQTARSPSLATSAPDTNPATATRKRTRKKSDSETPAQQ